MFGLCKLGLQKESDANTGHPLIIMDVKLDIPNPTEPKNEIFRNQNQFLEYNTLKQKEAELLQTIPPSLNQFYKNKVNEYFNNFN
jgi:hypothetical protein